jgi:antitoxin FitA
MFYTCVNVHHMSKMIQVRNVPDDLHRQLKVRAASLGMSLSDYLLGELRRIGERPTAEELDRRLRRRKPVYLGDLPARLIREAREDG